MTPLPRLNSVRFAYWLVLAWSQVVVGQLLIADRHDLGNTDRNFNIFFHLFVRFEAIAWFVLVLGVLAAVASLDRADPKDLQALFERLSGTRSRAVIAAVAFALFWLSTILVYHRYPFSMDEYASEFQARIFMAGKMKATLPEEWRAFGRALTPVFVSFDTSSNTWISSYLPVYSALRALFMSVRLGDALNPALGALSVLFIADTASRANPQRPFAPIVAVVLLLTSAQFFANSISYYSMPAHLCANLLWLSLYLRNTRWSLAVLPWLGGLAVGLHQPVVHALFVLPFLLEIVWRRRLALAAYYAAVYSAFLGLWYWWHQHAILADSVEHAREAFKAPGFSEAFTQSLNLTLAFSWQSAAFVVCLIVGLAAGRALTPLHRNLAIGLALTLGFYFFYYTNQGHGWGYRYVYGVLGNAILIATLGFTRLVGSSGPKRALHFLTVSTVIALCVQIPLRAFEVERIIAPFARARDYLASIDADIVVVDHIGIWYGQDMVRNDPLFRTRPRMLHAYMLRRDSIGTLRELGRTRVAHGKEFVALGMVANSEFVSSIERGEAAHPSPPK